jgi:hypothetical protein
MPSSHHAQVQKMLPKHALAYASFVFFAAGQS